MNEADLKVLVDALFAGALVAATGRPLVSSFLNLAKSWIDAQLTPIASAMAKG